MGKLQTSKRVALKKRIFRGRGFTGASISYRTREVGLKKLALGEVKLIYMPAAE